jgi:hypothetical protein
MLWLETIADALAVSACGVAAAQTLGLSALAWLACVLAGLVAWQVKRIRWYGLTLLWFPGALGFLATSADPLTRAWGAMLGMLGFYSLWCVLQARDEDAPSGWWAAVLLVIWQPGSLALLGLGFLAARATSRWRSHLAPARGALRHSSLPRSFSLAALALAVFGFSFLLPSPAPWRVQDVLLPSLEFQAPKAGFLSVQPDFRLRAGAAQTLGFDPRPVIFGILALGAVLVLQTRFQKSRGQTEAREIKTTKKPRAKFDPVLIFVIATVLVVMLIFWTIKTFSSRSLPVHMPSVSGWGVVILGVLFAIGALAATLLWLRMHLTKRRLKPLEIISFGSKKRPPLELPEDRIRAAYVRWLRLLSELELPRDRTETPFEFSRRVIVHHPDLRAATQTLTEAYERVRYGTQLLENDAQNAEDSLEIWRSNTTVPTQPGQDVTALTLEHSTALLD